MATALFPGQGSQSPAMGAPFVGHPAWALVDTASEVAGRDVGRLLLDAEADELRETHNAQLGTFVLSMVVLDALRDEGFVADSAAGHSLGEYSALCAAGVLGFDDAVRLVVERGEAMRDACAERPGTMAAVLGLDDDAVAAVCDEVDGEVFLANLNAPGQVVIAGEPDAVARASEAVRAAGAKRVMALEVAGAFHTPLMASAGHRLDAAIEAAAWNDAAIPVVANVDASVHTAGADWPALLQRQLTAPVRWTQSVQALVAGGAVSFVEIGPGAALTGMVKRIAPDSERRSVGSVDDVRAVATAGSSS